MVDRPKSLIFRPPAISVHRDSESPSESNAYGLYARHVLDQVQTDFHLHSTNAIRNRMLSDANSLRRREGADRKLYRYLRRPPRASEQNMHWNAEDFPAQIEERHFNGRFCEWIADQGSIHSFGKHSHVQWVLP